jgi:hypothetical protein
LYRAALDPSRDERELIGAIEGLGEVGAPDDAPFVLPFIHHKHARVRTAAIHALGSIGSNEQREAIIAALSDPSAKVCRAARRVLLRGAPVDPERLAFAALQSRYPHERRAAVELAGVHDHWVTGVLLLRIAATSDADTAARAGAMLARWEVRYNQVFTALARRQVQEFESLLERAHIDERLRHRLRLLVPVLEARSK